MKNKKINTDLAKLLDNTPATEEILKKLAETNGIDYENDPEFILDYLKGRITEDILNAMEEKGINKNQLAKRLGKSRQYVNKILNETANFTLDSLAKITCALNCKIEVKILNKKNYLENSSVYKKEVETSSIQVIQIARLRNENNTTKTGAQYENFILAS